MSPPRVGLKDGAPSASMALLLFLSASFLHASGQDSGQGNAYGSIADISGAQQAAYDAAAAGGASNDSISVCSSHTSFPGQTLLLSQDHAYLDYQPYFALQQLHWKPSKGSCCISKKQHAICACGHLGGSGLLLASYYPMKSLLVTLKLTWIDFWRFWFDRRL